MRFLSRIKVNPDTLGLIGDAIGMLLGAAIFAALIWIGCGLGISGPE